MKVNNLINKVIENQKENIIRKIHFCCGNLNFNNKVNIIETDNIKIIYNDKNECEIIRKQNNNPIIYRDKNQKIYRFHGEWNYIKSEMYKLAGINEEDANLEKTNELYTVYSNLTF